MTNIAQQTLIALAGVDSTKNLVEYYKRQTTQLEEHHANEAAVDKQRIAKAKAENWKDLMKEVANATVKGKQLAKKLKADNQARFRKKYQTKYEEGGPDATYAKGQRYRLESANADKDDKWVMEQLKLDLIDKGIYKVDDETTHGVLQDVMKISGSELQKMSVFMAEDNLLTATKNDFLTSIQGTALEEQYSSYSNDPARQAQMYRDYLNGRLGIYNVSDGLFASNFKAEVDRRVNTLHGSAKNAKVAQSNLNGKIAFQEPLLTSFKLEDNAYNSQTILINEIARRKHFYQDIEGGLTATQQATASVVGDLRSLVKSGAVSRDQLDRLFEDSDALKDHAAGLNIPKAFFDNEGKMEKSLFDDAIAYESGQLKLREEAADVELNVLWSKFTKGEITKEQLHASLVPHQQAGYLNKELNNKIENLFNLEKIDNKSEEFETLQKDLSDDITSGNIVNMSDDEIKTLYKDGALVKLAIQKRNEIKAAQKDLQFPKNDARFVDEIISFTINGESLGINENLPFNQANLSAEFLRKYRQLWMFRWSADKTNKNVTAEVNNEFKKMLADEGFGIQIGEPGAGIYSHDTTGGFPLFEFTRDADAQINTTFVGYDYDKLSKRTNNAITFVNDPKNAKIVVGENTVDKILNIQPGKPGSAVDAQDIVGALRNQKFSSEIILAARLLNITPTELVERGRQALLNGDDEIAKEFLNHKSIKDKVIQNPEQVIKDAIETAGDNDMLRLFNQKGVENFTPNQFERLRKILETETELNLKADDEYQYNKLLEQAQEIQNKTNRIEERVQNYTGGEEELTTDQANQSITQNYEPVQGSWQRIEGDDTGIMVFDGTNWVRKDFWTHWKRDGVGRPDLEFYGPINQ